MKEQYIKILDAIVLGFRDDQNEPMIMSAPLNYRNTDPTVEELYTHKSIGSNYVNTLEDAIFEFNKRSDKFEVVLLDPSEGISINGNYLFKISKK